MGSKWILEYAWLIAFLPFLAFAIIGLYLHRWPKISAYLSIASIGISSLLALGTAFAVFSTKEGVVYEAAMRWLDMPGLRVDMGMLLDPLAAVMLMVVTVVALLVQIYSLGYMHDEPGLASYYAYQSLFAGSMLGLVLANNFGQLYVFWELVGVCSYFLIGFWFGRNSAKEAAKKAFITNRVGDFAFLLGILFLQLLFGSLNYGSLATALEGYNHPATLLIVALLLFGGSIGKSAQFPLHVWLPDAMEGPTPVSALIHAATMVAAGVYLIARAFFIFSSSSEAMLIIAVVGGFTALFAASIALVLNDIKRILAYSTLSQLGYMIMAMGTGAMSASMFHLMTHAFFKSLLFLAAGSVIHALANEQDIFKMGNLYHKMPVTAGAFIVGALSLSGIPPLSGFWSKDEILAGALGSGHIILYLLGLMVALMTAFYMFRLVFVVFFGSNQAEGNPHESPWIMTAPLAILAGVSVVAGLPGSPLMKYAFGHYINTPAALHVQPGLLTMILSTLFALAGIGLAWAMYQQKLLEPRLLVGKVPKLYKLLINRYYIDEFYAWLVARVVDKSAAWLFWADINIVNRLVNNIAFFTGRSGETLRYTEDGQVQSYALYMLGGIVVILAAALYLSDVI
ncbi:MAG: NADH-quinone oxidoreductase subunit L [Syntrophomonadaceae bacterium]|nr:NADH-quinone oxidoreductase subunit L [Syntrophomonadaceae bacterium]MDD3022537.1 NADH-quinone oxidoreductase subunit L [Syntrophomonadaceae bacterium]